MRWSVAVESDPSLGAGAAIAGVYPVLLANPNGPPTFSVRRVTIGGYGASTAQQVAVQIARATPGGGSITGLVPMDAGAKVVDANFLVGRAASQYGGTDPIANGGMLYEMCFNTQSPGVEMEWEYGELQLPYISVGAGLGLALYNTVAVPTGFIYAASFEVELI